MPAPDPLFAQWLLAPADFTVRSAAVQPWGTTARTIEQISGIATLAGAQVEGDRQLAFFAAGPLAVEVHQFAGVDWVTALGCVVTVTIDQLGYDAGIDVFVIEVQADRATGMSQVVVLRRLAS